MAGNLNPVGSREQAGRRPALVVSIDSFNHGPAERVTIIPVSGSDRGIPLHTRVEPPEGGLTKTSYIPCDQMRTISRSQLASRWGAVNADTLAAIEDNLMILLGL